MHDKWKLFSNNRPQNDIARYIAYDYNLATFYRLNQNYKLRDPIVTTTLKLWTDGIIKTSKWKKLKFNFLSAPSLKSRFSSTLDIDLYFKYYPFEIKKIPVCLLMNPNGMSEFLLESNYSRIIADEFRLKSVLWLNTLYCWGHIYTVTYIARQPDSWPDWIFESTNQSNEFIERVSLFISKHTKSDIKPEAFQIDSY